MKKIFRFAIVCAVAGAALLTGCTKDFTSDIDNLKTQIGDLDKKIDEKFGDLQKAINAGALISAVEPFTTPAPGGVKISFTGDKAPVTIYNGANGKDADVWEIKDGYWALNGTKTSMKAVPTEWTIGSDGYWYQDGKKTSVKAEGKDGSSATPTEWTIGADGYWYKDGKKTDVKAAASDGANGTNGSYWKPNTTTNVWEEFDGNGVATGNTIPLYAEGGSGSSTPSGITAIWNKEEGYIEFSGVEGIDKAVRIELTKPLKGLAFVPERIFDGLGLITAYEVYAPATTKKGVSTITDATGAAIEVKGFPTVDKKDEGTFLTTAPIAVSYRANPQNINVEDYAWDFINRKVYTKSVEDNDDLVTLVTGPVAHGSHYDFTIKLNKSVEAADHAKNNDIVALRAIAKDATLKGEQEHIVSDYAYIEKEIVKDFYIIHKDGEFCYKDGEKDVVYEYESDDPKYYRWENFVAIDEPTDFNDIPTPTPGKGIDTPAPATSGTNPKAIALPYDGTIDLLDYVETYSFEKKDLASTLGITPTYKFQFAGYNEATKEVIINNDPEKAIYLAADVDKTNQNKFIKFDGSKISVNDAFVTLLTPAIGRTPLVYVQSLYDGKLLAECLIKIEITAEPAPAVENKGWDVFIWHDATFPYKLPATASYTGKSGTASAPHQNKEHGKSFTEEDKDLNVTWDEVNPWVLDDAHINMSYEDFGDKYDLSNPKLILTKDSKEPGATLPAKKDAVLVDPADINTYYSASGSGLTITSQSPANWKQSTNIVDLKIDETFKELNAPDANGKHYVYVVYLAKDNVKNMDVVVKFSFNKEPHVHDWTILKKYNDKTFWILNPDYIQGPQDLLIEPKPAADAYYGKGGLDAPDQYKTYGAVRVKGLEDDLRSAIVEHFKEYANCWKNANEESDYVFKIYNYTNDVVDIVNGGTTTAIANEDGYATVTISGADLKKIAEGTAVSPDILVRKPAGLSVGKDILVQVTELCNTEASTKIVKDLDAKDYGKTYVQAYYYVIFEAIKPTVKFNEVKLGDFKDQNDYALISEIVAGVYESDATDAVALFTWDAAAKTWVLGPSAATYGITDATKISFKINKLIYGKNEKDTEDSFKGRLSIFEAGDPIAPWPVPSGSVAEGGIDWRNDGTNLEQDKIAGFELEVFYDSESLTKGEGEVTVMKTNSKPHPNHKQDGSIWE